ncbi:MAG: threonine/serine exporter family protein [Clostridia bacterium]|nr:threonine/serine exporter family protein [Clostridia bacterium]
MEKELTCVMNIAEEMIISGAEVHRVEESVVRMCTALGAIKTDVFIITSNIIATIRLENGESFTQTRRITTSTTSVEKIHALNSLSRNICAKKTIDDNALNELERIKKITMYPFWIEVIAYAVIAWAFTLFFGGTLIESLVSLFIGAVVRFGIFFTDKVINNRIFSKFLSSVIASFLALVAVRLEIVEGVDKIIIGNIMTLIPGIGLTNAFRDLFIGDSIAGILRTVEAVLTAIAIAAGYFIAVLIDRSGSHLVIRSVEPNELVQIITGFIGSVGFAFLFNIRGLRFVIAGLGGLISWSLFLLLTLFIPSESVCYFIVALSIAIYAEIMARVIKTPTTTFIMTSLIPLIPGGSLYYTMSHLIGGNVNNFLETGTVTLSLSIALALGIIIATALTKIVLTLINKVKTNKINSR